MRSLVSPWLTIVPVGLAVAVRPRAVDHPSACSKWPHVAAFPLHGEFSAVEFAVYGCSPGRATGAHVDQGEGTCKLTSSMIMGQYRRHLMETKCT